MGEEATLITIRSETDEDGFPVETTSRTDVYVRPKSAVRAEFYDAIRSGFRPTIVFEMRIEDFAPAKDATRVEHDGQTYDIIRTYCPDKSMIELICS